MMTRRFQAQHLLIAHLVGFRMERISRFLMQAENFLSLLFRIYFNAAILAKRNKYKFSISNSIIVSNPILPIRKWRN